MGAYRAGAGLVTLACGKSVHPILAAKLTEATFEPLEDKDGELSGQESGTVARTVARGYECLLVGPGLGQSGYVQAFIKGLLPMLTTEPAADSRRALLGLVLDADGLNNLARIDGWPRLISVPTVLTPHPGEFSRLTGMSIENVQADRLGNARRFAEEWGVIVLLKGAPSVVAAPDGRSAISAFTNPGLASGGTGDVLAGTIAGYVAQGVEPFDAACLGLYIGGLAAEEVRRELGSAGMLAGDLLLAIPRAMRDLRGESPRAPPAAPGGADLLAMLAQHQEPA
jgi:NAD(P)H-hydrate epimerase